jgi:uncharacterized protein (TIGR02118 family)
MIKVSVMYPNTAGARFDHQYYRDHHMPLVKEKLADRCLFYTIDKGLGGASPDAHAPYVAMCHVFCESAKAFQDGMALQGKAIFDDISHFTDLVPVIQISEVVIGQR